MFLSNPFRFFPDTLYNSFGEKSIFAPYFCVTKFNTQTNKRSWYYKILGTLFSTKANSIFFNFQKLFLYSKKILFVITSFEKKLIEKENQRPTKLMIRGVVTCLLVPGVFSYFFYCFFNRRIISKRDFIFPACKSTSSKMFILKRRKEKFNYFLAIYHTAFLDL